MSSKSVFPHCRGNEKYLFVGDRLQTQMYKTTISNTCLGYTTSKGINRHAKKPKSKRSPKCNHENIHYSELYNTHETKTSNTFQTPIRDMKHQKASIHMQKSQDQKSAQNRFLCKTKIMKNICSWSQVTKTTCTKLRPHTPYKHLFGVHIKRHQSTCKKAYIKNEPRITFSASPRS